MANQEAGGNRDGCQNAGIDFRSDGGRGPYIVLANVVAKKRKEK